MTIQGITSLLLTRISCSARNVRFWNIHRDHPIWVHAITISSPKWKNQCEEPVQHTRWTYPFYRVVSTEHQIIWTRWWCTTPSKHFEVGLENLECCWSARMRGIVNRDGGSILYSRLKCRWNSTTFSVLQYHFKSAIRCPKDNLGSIWMLLINI